MSKYTPVSGEVCQWQSTLKGGIWSEPLTPAWITPKQVAYFNCDGYVCLVSLTHDFRKYDANIPMKEELVEILANNNGWYEQADAILAAGFTNAKYN